MSSDSVSWQPLINLFAFSTRRTDTFCEPHILAVPSTADKSAPEAASALAGAAGIASPSIKPTYDKSDGKGFAERVPSQRITQCTHAPMCMHSAH